MAEPEEELLESGQSEEGEEEDDEEEQEKQADVRSAVGIQHVRAKGSSFLNKSILIALIVAVSMGFGHFYGEHFSDVAGSLYFVLLILIFLIQCSF